MRNSECGREGKADKGRKGMKKNFLTRGRERGTEKNKEGEKNLENPARRDEVRRGGQLGPNHFELTAHLPPPSNVWYRQLEMILRVCFPPTASGLAASSRTLLIHASRQ